MIFFALHNIMHNVVPGNFTDQTRNLVTFLLGIVLYTVLYTYLFNKNNNSTNLLINSIKAGFSYIIMSDCIAMGIIYKNYYKSSIINEVKEAWIDPISSNKNISTKNDDINIAGKHIIDNIISEAQSISNKDISKTNTQRVASSNSLDTDELKKFIDNVASNNRKDYFGKKVIDNIVNECVVKPKFVKFNNTEQIINTKLNTNEEINSDIDTDIISEISSNDNIKDSIVQLD